MKFQRRKILSLAAAGAATSCIPSLVLSQTATSFRIGALSPITGAGSPYGTGMQKAIQLAVEEVNAAGGAAGRKLEVFYEDDQTQPQAGVLAAKKLIEVNKIEALIGTWASGVTLAVMPLTDEANIIEMNVSGAPAISLLDKKDMVWRFQATNDRFGAAFAEIAKKRGFKRPATMAFNNASGRGNTDGFKRVWESRGGKVVSEVVYEPNRPSYRSELQKVLTEKPDVIVMGSYLPDTTIILREWYQSGDKVSWIIPAWAANPELIKAVGPEVAEGLISVDTVSNENAPSYKPLNERFQKAAGSPLSGNIYAAMCYDMVISLALAIELAGAKATPQQVSNHMRDVSNSPGSAVFSFAQGKQLIARKQKINYEGISSKLDFDASGDAKADFGVYVIEAGKLVRRNTISVE